MGVSEDQEIVLADHNEVGPHQVFFEDLEMYYCENERLNKDNVHSRAPHPPHQNQFCSMTF